MSQYLQAAQAFGIVADTVAQPASPPESDLRNLHRRIVDEIGERAGTTQYGTVRSKTGGALTLRFDDAIYTQLVADGVDFSDALYNSASAPTGDAANSKIPSLWNHGGFKQVVDILGTSIVNSSVGSGTHPELSDTAFKLWTQPVVQLARPYTVVTTGVATLPDRAFTNRWVQEKSRLVRNFGRDSGRSTNISGFTYTVGTPWVPNLQQLAHQVICPGQQHVFLIDLGTNDIAYADDSGNPGLAAVPTGTPGATYAGSPNFIEDSLEPLIAGLQAIDPDALIVYSTPIARGSSVSHNGKFSEIAAFVVANRVALGLDAVIDTRQIPQFDCRNISVTADTNYYQADRIHLIGAANIIMGAAFTAALDALL